MRWLRWLLVCVVFTAAMAASDNPGAEVLGRWVGGNWPLQGRTLDTEFGKAATLKGLSTCNWSPEHVFVICDEVVYVNNNPERNLGVYSFDPKSGKYRYVELTPQGAQPEVSELIITENGSRWEYRGEQEIKGKKIIFHTINVYRDVDHIDWWNEYSTDGGQHWARSAEGTEIRKQ